MQAGPNGAGSTQEAPVQGVPVQGVPVEGPVSPALPPLANGSDKANRVQNFKEQTGLVKKIADDHCAATSDFYYIKHVGFNNIEIRQGKDDKGPVVWYIDVKAKIVGWSITVRRADGSPVMHLKKDITFARLLGWDKGSTVDVRNPPQEDELSTKDSNSSLGSKSSFDKVKRKMMLKSNQTKKALETKETVVGEPQDGDVIVPDGQADEYAELTEKEMAELPAQKVTTIHRKHAFRSNANEFIHNGKVYVWNYWIFLGSALNLTEKATGDVLAEVQLLPTWRWQIISSWSWRLDGVLEIKEGAKREGLEDIIVTTLTAMLEWRKHNNKVWIVAAAIA